MVEDVCSGKENKPAGLEAEEACKVFNSFLQKSGKKEISAFQFGKGLTAVFPNLGKKRRRSGCGEKKTAYNSINNTHLTSVLFL